MHATIFQSRSWFFNCSTIWVLVTCVGLGGLTGCMSTAPTVESPGVIAVVDFQRILEETRAGKELKESFDSFVKDRQVLLELEQQEIQRMRNDLVNQGSVLSESARREREEKFQRRVRDYQVKEAALSRELQGKQQDLMTDFRSNVTEVVARLAQDREFVIVVERGQGSSTLYHRPQLDISDDIIKEMDQDE
ncbi:OmpH family outer membrane protein [Candidatus Nitrospira salsa]